LSSKISKAYNTPLQQLAPTPIIKLLLIFFFSELNNSVPFAFSLRIYFATYISKADMIILFSNFLGDPELKIPNLQMGSFPKAYFKASKLQLGNIPLQT
jgi:hypothetical protein